MSIIQQAMSSVDAGDAQDTERRRLEKRPTNKVRHFVPSIEKMLREAQAERLSMEADHVVHMDEVRNRISSEKAELSRSIHELEKQLSELRIRWAKISDDGERELADTRREFLAELDAQDRIIEMHRNMLKTLVP